MPVRILANSLFMLSTDFAIFCLVSVTNCSIRYPSITRVPIGSPFTARTTPPGVESAKTTIGSLCSLHRETAVMSMTASFVSITSR